MKKIKKGISKGKMVAIGGAAVAAGAGAYYFLDKNSKKHQKELKEQFKKAKKVVNEVVKKVINQTDIQVKKKHKTKKLK